MGLNNSQYNSILREYDTKQYNAKHELDLRTREIEKVIPEFKELNDQIITSSISLAKKALFSDNKTAIEELKSNNLDIAMKKIELLVFYCLIVRIFH